ELVVHQSGVNANRNLLAIDPVTRAQRLLLTLDPGVGMDALEFVAGPTFGHRVKLGPDHEALPADFGNQSVLGTLSGTKWEDVNGNGVRDAGEPVMQGFTVYLDANDNGQLDAGELSAVTDENGNYSFTGLVPGDYVVREVVPFGYAQATPKPAPARLFASNTNLNPDEIIELDPQTGALVNLFPAPVPTSTTAHSLAFDGAVLYFLANNTTLYELDPDTG